MEAKKFVEGYRVTIWDRGPTAASFDTHRLCRGCARLRLPQTVDMTTRGDTIHVKKVALRGGEPLCAQGSSQQDYQAAVGCNVVLHSRAEGAQMPAPQV